MIKIFQVDAFTDQLFKGNPAAVCPLKKWLPDETLQAIAAENNLSETAFFIPGEDGYDLRWFTPTTEVDLCGHATLATAHVLFEELDHEGIGVLFNTKSGILTVTKIDPGMRMDFPVDIPKEIGGNNFINQGLGLTPQKVLKGKTDYLAILSSQEEVEKIEPDFTAISQLKSRGLIVSAPGKEVDFVSRCFFPQSGVDEDPVTGSAHTTLTPYWAEILKKDTLSARQISKRGGKMVCALENNRVLLYRQAKTYLRGVVVI